MARSMLKLGLALSLLLSTIGCDPPKAPPPTPPSVDATPGTGTEPAKTPTASPPSPALRTVESAAFSLQIPSDWKDQTVGGGLGISSPLDLQNPSKMLVVAVSVIPLPPRPGKTSADGVAVLLQADKISGEVESETTITVSGRPATKFVKKHSVKLTETTESVHRLVKVLCPVNDGVFLLQVDANEQVLESRMPQLDAIIESIKIK